jgi:hypothetical protein
MIGRWSEIGFRAAVPNDGAGVREKGFGPGLRS